MKIVAAAVVAFLLMTAQGFCQTAQPSREETFQLISEVVADVNRSVFSDPKLAQSAEFRAQLQDALRRLADLKDWLKTNPYVQLAGFSIGTGGVTIDFVFP